MKRVNNYGQNVLHLNASISIGARSFEIILNGAKPSLELPRLRTDASCLLKQAHSELSAAIF